MNRPEVRSLVRPPQEELDRLHAVACCVDEAEMTLLGLRKRRPEAFKNRIASGSCCPGATGAGANSQEYSDYWVLMDEIAEAAKEKTDAYTKAEQIYGNSAPTLVAAEVDVA